MHERQDNNTEAEHEQDKMWFKNELKDRGSNWG